MDWVSAEVEGGPILSPAAEQQRTWQGKGKERAQNRMREEPVFPDCLHSVVQK